MRKGLPCPNLLAPVHPSVSVWNSLDDFVACNVPVGSSLQWQKSGKDARGGKSKEEFAEEQDGT